MIHERAASRVGVIPGETRELLKTRRQPLPFLPPLSCVTDRKGCETAVAIGFGMCWEGLGTAPGSVRGVGLGHGQTQGVIAAQRRRLKAMAAIITWALALVSPM